MPIPVRCVCGKRYSAKDEHAGKSLKCSCGQTVPIPSGTLVAWIIPVLALLTRAWLGIAVLALVLLWFLGDRWWPVTLFLYGPRWPLLLPGILLAPGALLFRRRLLPMQGLTVALILIPVMGFTLGWRGLLPGPEPTFRVVTFNVAGLTGTAPAGLTLGLSNYEPDVIALQECPEWLAGAEYWREGWHTRARNQICLASRHPILSAVAEERVLTGEQGGTGTVVLFRLAAPGDTVEIAVVHLETPRKGLEPFAYRGGGTGSVRLNILVRDAGSSRSSRWIRTQTRAPLIVGDFNLTVESGIYRTHWSDCANAFTLAGKGFGYTRVLKRFSVRIDHVLACPGWRPVAAEVGPDLGSDHRPLVVDLIRR